MGRRWKPLPAHMPPPLPSGPPPPSSEASPKQETMAKSHKRDLAVDMNPAVGGETGPLEPLVAMLRIATKNPANSAYNHYMFECISALVEYDAPQVADIEEALFAPFAEILRDDVSEFRPYVFQIYAQMLYTNEGVSAVVRFLNVFIEKDPQRIVAKHLNTVVNIATVLCRSKTTDHDGFALLRQLLLSIPEEHLGPGVRLRPGTKCATSTQEVRSMVSSGTPIVHF